MTQRVGLIGMPLKRRHSQVMHDAAFDAAGMDARYVLLELDVHRVLAGLARLGWSDDKILQHGFVCFDALYSQVKAS